MQTVADFFTGICIFMTILHIKNANLANQPTFLKTLYTRVRERGCIYFWKRSVGWQGWREEGMFCSLYNSRAERSGGIKSAGGFAYME